MTRTLVVALLLAAGASRAASAQEDVIDVIFTSVRAESTSQASSCILARRVENRSKYHLDGMTFRVGDHSFEVGEMSARTAIDEPRAAVVSVNAASGCAELAQQLIANAGAARVYDCAIPYVPEGDCQDMVRISVAFSLPPSRPAAASPAAASSQPAVSPQPVSSQPAASGTPPWAAPASRPQTPAVAAAVVTSDLASLHPDVRAAVIRARQEAQRAEAAAGRAGVAEAAAEDAARRARAEAPGTIAETITYGNPSNTARFETEISRGVRIGHGVQTLTEGPFAGDVYAGEWKGNRREGFGVYAFAQNRNNSSRVLRYEGEFVNDRADGVGVLYWRNGDKYVGRGVDWTKVGPGVLHFADGHRYEGDWSDDTYNGHGVLWDADGQVVSAGVWRNGRLATPLAP